jgi:ADP-ribose pyrophosphatase
MEENPEKVIIEHKEIYSGKIVKLHVDKVLQASGATVIREVVIHPGGVTAIPVLDDGRIVLERQFRYALQKYIFELPAGKLDKGVPPEVQIADELEEEIGCKAGSIDYLTTFYTTPGICTEAIHLYVARNLVKCNQSLEEGEHLTVEAYTVEECIEKIRSGEICDGKTILGILWYKMFIQTVS